MTRQEMTGLLAGKAVVVTGSSRGIGAAIAALAAEQGARVVVNGVDPSAAEEHAARIRAAGGTAVAFAGDLSQWENAARLIECCMDNFGRIDGLVNNAGIHRLDRVEATTEADMRRAMEVNVLGPAFVTRHAVPHMQAQKCGSIVCVTSGVAAGRPLMTVYGATKGAINSFIYGWSAELGACGIRVNGLSPVADTRLTAEAATFFSENGIPLRKDVSGPSAQNCAPPAVFLLSDLAAEINGQVIRINGEKLSMMSPQAVAMPVLERAGGWDLPAIAKAFRGELANVRFGQGLLRLTITDIASANT